jgi:hypothetical protein
LEESVAGAVALSRRTTTMSRGKEPISERIKQFALVVLLLAIILPLSLIGFSLFLLHRAALYLLVWVVWLPRGKDTLFVYSESPIWRDYMIEQVLPLVHQRAVVLNWSERSTWRWWAFPVHVFRSFAGGQKYNPVVILFRPFRRAQKFRFWSAFKEQKHGNADSVDRLRNELLLKLE